MLASRMPGPFAERATKRITVAAIALAIPLHLYVDPAVDGLLRVLAAALFVAAFASARRWPHATVMTVAAVSTLLPVALAALLRVAALNVFYTMILAAVFGALLPRMPFDRWVLPPSWRAPLAVWALTLSLAWPVMIIREAGVRLGTLRDTGALDSWAFLTTPQIESWILYVVITQLVAVLWLESMFIPGSAIRDQGSVGFSDPESRIPDPGVHGLWIGASLASVVAVYQGTFDMGFLSGGPWPGLQRAAGTLLDANAYGAIAALAAPFAFVCIPYVVTSHTRTAQGGVLALNWAGAWMSGSRTALLCGAFGTVLLIYELLRSERHDEIASRNTSSLLAAAAVVVLVLAVGAGAVGPVRRIVEARGAESARQLWSRGGYGTVSVRMIRDFPFTGVGVGSFNWMAPDYWREIAHDRLPFDNAQNWWRHQVAELGLIASLPILLWSSMIAWAVFTRRSHTGRRIETETLRGLLIGVAIASLVGMPTQNPIVLLVFFSIAARFEILTRTENERIPDPGSRIPSVAWTAGILVALGYAAAHMALARGPLKPINRAAATNRDYITGTYPSERTPQGMFRWTKKHSTWALAVPTRHFVIRYHVQHPDAGTHPVKLRITTPCQTLVDEFRKDDSVDGRSFELPEGQQRVTFDTDVSRTWRPSATGGTDTRELGAAIEADFVASSGVVASEDAWIPLKRCEP
jgi:hypothetical protein